jgi:hypothetical protein
MSPPEKRERDTSPITRTRLKRQAHESERTEKRPSQVFRSGGPVQPGDQVLKAMDHVEKELKDAYVLATQNCPQLIRTETDPHCSLKHANWNPLE